MDKAIQGKTTKRYLPEAAWKRLSPEQREATDSKKRNASRTGRQFVENTEAAKKARRAAQVSSRYKSGR